MTRLCKAAVLASVIVCNIDATLAVKWMAHGRNSAGWHSRGTVNSDQRDGVAAASMTPTALTANGGRIHAHLSPLLCLLAPPSLMLRGGYRRIDDANALGEDAEAVGGDGVGESAEGDGIDENLYSRQLYVLGKSAMAKMRNSDVLISGMSGLGAEVAKNVILAGVRSVTLHDDRPSTTEDLSSQFCIDEAASREGTPRARASVDYLRELNPYVDVRLLEGPLTEDMIADRNYTAVLLVDEAVGLQLRMDEACRRAGTCFLAASSRGVFASLFCDFGDRFVVEDRDGEEPLACFLGSVTREEGQPGGRCRWAVEAVDGERHHFQAGDIIRFEDAKDATGALVDVPEGEFTVENVINTKRFSITIEACPPGGGGDDVLSRVADGRAVQVKKPLSISFLNLREALRPENVQELILPTDFGKLNPSRQMTVHACFLCLDDFRRHNGGRFPIPGSAKDANAFMTLVQNSPFFSDAGGNAAGGGGERKGRGMKVDEGIVEAFSRTCAGGLSPVSGFYGGVVAQEVLKGCSQLFVPTRQFAYFDCVEVLPRPLPTLKACAARGDRYDGQRAVLGDAVQRALFSKRLFVVGAGAIGCELLKSLALMGVGCCPNGVRDSSGGMAGRAGGGKEESRGSEECDRALVKSGEAGGEEGEKEGGGVVDGGRGSGVPWRRRVWRLWKTRSRGRYASTDMEESDPSSGGGAPASDGADTSDTDDDVVAAAGAPADDGVDATDTDDAVVAAAGAGVAEPSDDGEGTEGAIVVTDMDTIEKSNLNRQFLFRGADVGKAKSAAAAAAARRLNPGLVIKPLEKKVGPETETFFDEDFWESLDCVVNALDNVDARLYVDSKCVDFGRPLLESGTLGTKGNTQVVLPFQTESYGSSVDPDDGSIPLCTLKHHPYLIEHAVHWARDTFDGLFQVRPRNAERLAKATMGSPSEEADIMRELRGQGAFECWQALRDARKDLEAEAPKSFSDCLDWSKMQFRQLFHDSTLALLRQHPLGSTDDEGDPFWSGVRRPPTPLKLDSFNASHREFVWWAAVLRAGVYGIDVPRSLGYLVDNKGAGATGNAEQHHPGLAGEAKVKTAEPVAREADPDEAIEPLIRLELTKLRKAVAASWRALGSEGGPILRPAEFEKDDDLNGHVDFVTAASNLRAASYGIPTADRLSTKRIAGKIVPAIATTTAVVSGLSCLELLKLVQGAPMEHHKNAFVNLAEPFVTFSEPLPAEPVAGEAAAGGDFTIWDKIVVDGAANMTARGLVSLLKSERGAAEVSMISYNNAFLYASFLHTDDEDPALDMPLWELADEVDAEGGDGRDWMSRDAPGALTSPEENASSFSTDEIGGRHPLDIDAGTKDAFLAQGVSMGGGGGGKPGHGDGDHGEFGGGVATAAVNGVRNIGTGGSGYDGGVERGLYTDADGVGAGGGIDSNDDRKGYNFDGFSWPQQQQGVEGDVQHPSALWPPEQAEKFHGLESWGEEYAQPYAPALDLPSGRETGDHQMNAGPEDGPPLTSSQVVPPPFPDWFEEQFGTGELRAPGSSATRDDPLDLETAGSCDADRGVFVSGERSFELGETLSFPGALGAAPSSFHPPGADSEVGAGQRASAPQVPDPSETPDMRRGSPDASGPRDGVFTTQGEGWTGPPVKDNVVATEGVAEKVGVCMEGEDGENSARPRTNRLRRRRRYLDLEVFCDDENGEELRLPPVRLDLRSDSRGAGTEAEGRGITGSSRGNGNDREGFMRSGQAVLKRVTRRAWSALLANLDLGQDDDDYHDHEREDDDAIARTVGERTTGGSGER